MKHLVLALAVALLLADLAQAAPLTPPARSAQDAPGIAQRINSAGRVRQQAQRISKLYLQIGLGLNTDMARLQLGSATQQMDADLKELAAHSSNERTQPTLERLNEVWADMKRAVVSAYSVEHRNLVNYLAEDLTIAAGKLAMQIERDAETPSGRLLDLSLRQSMLVQRLARLYLMAHAGDNSTGRQVDIEQTRREFSAALNDLSSSAGNTRASREALELAKMQWFFFENAIEGLKNGQGSNPKHVATTSERIMEALDSVSAEYARAGSPARSANEAQMAEAPVKSRKN